MSDRPRPEPFAGDRSPTESVVGRGRVGGHGVSGAGGDREVADDAEVAGDREVADDAEVADDREVADDAEFGADEPELEALLAHIEERLARPPDEVTTRRHLAAIAMVTSGQQMSARSRARAVFGRRAATRVVAAVAASVLLLAVAGLLPAPMQSLAAETVARVGIELPYDRSGGPEVPARPQVADELQDPVLPEAPTGDGTVADRQPGTERDRGTETSDGRRTTADGTPGSGGDGRPAAVEDGPPVPERPTDRVPLDQLPPDGPPSPGAPLEGRPVPDVAPAPETPPAPERELPRRSPASAPPQAPSGEPTGAPTGAPTGSENP